jgi:class 3 adenylate cyclase
MSQPDNKSSSPTAHDLDLLPQTMRRLIETQEKLKEEAERYRQLWQNENQRNSELLRSLVPAHLAAKMNATDTIIAEGYADVSVLFADIVNFTGISGELTPHAVVRLLDSFFTPIDVMCEKYKVEKIKTIGDAYMLAGGLDPSDDGSHTERVICLALDILDLARSLPPVLDRPFGVRIGVATGPVIAGVIGVKKVTYDLWGDTVNIAARMCSEADQMGIAIDDLTFFSVSDQFNVIGPETVEIKGKGALKVYRLAGEKA